MKTNAKKIGFTKITISQLNRESMAQIKGASKKPPCTIQTIDQGNKCKEAYL